MVSALGRRIGSARDLYPGTARYARLQQREKHDRGLARLVLAYRRAHGIGKIGYPEAHEIRAAKAWRRKTA